MIIKDTARVHLAHFVHTQRNIVIPDLRSLRLHPRVFKRGKPVWPGAYWLCRQCPLIGCSGKRYVMPNSLYYETISICEREMSRYSHLILHHFKNPRGASCLSSWCPDLITLYFTWNWVLSLRANRADEPRSQFLWLADMFHNIHIQILQTDLYTFLSWIDKDQSIFPYAIILLILIT